MAEVMICQEPSDLEAKIDALSPEQRKSLLKLWDELKGISPDDVETMLSFRDHSQDAA